ncbi:MAG: glutamate mutase L, partial [Candidatus Latescibacteria bacterium]|nr:glutamate mutase L [Candidatus Latescibacterota bacterium]
IRPVLEQENLGPARHVIHELFLEHVMAQAPGYGKLMSWTDAPIMPTPAAVGLIMQTVARQHGINVVGVDIGGATTDVFSVFGKVFNRTVSANLGMSYSVSNVLSEAGMGNVIRWVPFRIDEADLRDRIKNKMIRPTTVPQTLEELQIEQAIAREALRLAFQQHQALAVGLKGVQVERTLSDVFDQSEAGGSIVDLRELDLLVGSGGALSHAPRRVQAAAMMVDAFQPQGVTRLAVDSIFMMPHLGVLSTVDEGAANEVFERDCLIDLGTCIALSGEGKPDEPCATFEIGLPEGAESGELTAGELRRFPLVEGETAEAVVMPSRRWDAGAGQGQELRATVKGGVAGLILDGRGRPIAVPQDTGERVERVLDWSRSLDLYPEQ